MDITGCGIRFLCFVFIMRKQLEIAPLMNGRVFYIKENHGEIAFDKQFSCA